jgi:O-antigen/teichoic acid export membrane protein
VHLIWSHNIFRDWTRPRASATWRTWFIARTPWLVISGFAEAINQKIDIVMLERLRGAHEAGLYAAAAKISEAWYAVPFLLVTAVFPTIVKAQDEGRLHDNDWQRLLDAMFALTLLVSVVIQWVATPLVDLLFGEPFRESASVLAIHAWAGLFVGMRAVLSRWIITADVLWLSTWMACAGAIVNVGLNLLLIPRHGAQGAAVATAVSYATAAWLALFVHERSRLLGKMMFRSLLLPFRLRAVKDYVRVLRA